MQFLPVRRAAQTWIQRRGMDEIAAARFLQWNQDDQPAKQSKPGRYDNMGGNVTGISGMMNEFCYRRLRRLRLR